MSRGGQVSKRQIASDPLYGNKVIAKFINRVMRDGKKSVAQKEVYRALEIIKKEINEDPEKVFTQALENAKPTMEVRPRRVGGAAYQVPMAVRGIRRESLAIRWLIKSAQSKPNSEFRTFAEKLARELMDAAKGEGGAIKKKQEIERVAEANRAFSHFRW